MALQPVVALGLTALVALGIFYVRNTRADRDIFSDIASGLGWNENSRAYRDVMSGVVDDSSVEAVIAQHQSALAAYRALSEDQQAAHPDAPYEIESSAKEAIRNIGVRLVCGATSIGSDMDDRDVLKQVYEGLALIGRVGCRLDESMLPSVVNLLDARHRNVCDGRDKRDIGIANAITAGPSGELASDLAKRLFNHPSYRSDNIVYAVAALWPEHITPPPIEPLLKLDA